MLYTNYTKEILGLQDAEVEKVCEIEKRIEITVRLKRKVHICPFCGRKTEKIHDYRSQRIKDLPAFGKPVVVILRKRRYDCECGKHFFEENSFLGKYQRRTFRVTKSMLQKLTDVRSYKSVANEFGVSASNVMRLFKAINFPKPSELPEALGIDEFKGNSGKQKYHCILTDLKNGKVIDILHTRYEKDLIDYFKGYDRTKVKYLVSDMYKTYSEIAKVYFPNAIYIIDRYHWIRQTIWAFENVRKEVQKKFNKTHRKYFKKSRKLLLKRAKELTDEQMQQVNIMLYASADLSNAYFLKERMYRILDEENPANQKVMLKEWIEDASDSEIKSFVKCADTYRTWFTPISNSFYYGYTNGFTEGCNNKIKVLKRNAFGLKKFQMFRNRILTIFS